MLSSPGIGLAGVAAGMQTFDKAILDAYAKSLIDEQTALAYALSRSVVLRGIDNIKNLRGEKTTDVEGLALDDEYEKRLTEDAAGS
ncbi:hypothetical protein NKDENANG_03967 [Candidatus Entotheonellaceae bacterium PAL068K]